MSRIFRITAVFLVVLAYVAGTDAYAGQKRRTPNVRQNPPKVSLPAPQRSSTNPDNWDNKNNYYPSLPSTSDREAVGTTGPTLLNYDRDRQNDPEVRSSVDRSSLIRGSANRKVK